MTPEQKEAMMEIYFSAVEAANKIGPFLIEETEGDVPITTTAAAILLAGFCIQAKISMHDAVDILMSAYKQALLLQEDES